MSKYLKYYVSRATCYYEISTRNNNDTHQDLVNKVGRNKVINGWIIYWFVFFLFLECFTVVHILKAVKILNLI